MNNLNSRPPNTGDDNSSVDNFLPVKSKYFQHLTASHNENGNCHTEFESKIKDILFREVLSFIESAEGLEIVVSTAVTSVRNRHEQIRSYLGDTLTTRDNGKIRELYLRIIRHSNIEVVKHKPQLIVRWADIESPSKTSDKDSNSL